MTIQALLIMMAAAIIIADSAYRSRPRWMKDPPEIFAFGEHMQQAIRLWLEDKPGALARVVNIVAAKGRRSIAQGKNDRKALHGLVSDPKKDLLAEIPGGTGQTLLREALLAADHLAYHVGELVFLRKMLGAWS